MTKAQKAGLVVMGDGEWHKPGRTGNKVNSTVLFNLQDLGYVEQDKTEGSGWKGYRITEKGQAKLNES